MHLKRCQDRIRKVSAPAVLRFAAVSASMMQGVVPLPVTAELDICWWLKPAQVLRRGRGEEQKKKTTKIYFQTKSSRRNVLSVYRDGREPMQY